MPAAGRGSAAARRRPRPPDRPRPARPAPARRLPLRPPPRVRRRSPPGRLGLDHRFGHDRGGDCLRDGGRSGRRSSRSGPRFRRIGGAGGTRASAVAGGGSTGCRTGGVGPVRQPVAGRFRAWRDRRRRRHRPRRGGCEPGSRRRPNARGRGHRPGELRLDRRRESRPAVEQPEERAEGGLRPAGQLGLELGEALDRVAVDDDPGLVQAQLDRRLVRWRSRACGGTGGS